MTAIYYKGFKVQDKYLDRIRDKLKEDEDGHQIWGGASCGEGRSPQIGVVVEDGDGTKKQKVFSVARILYINFHGSAPTKLTRKSQVCSNLLCVNPEHFES